MLEIFNNKQYATRKALNQPSNIWKWLLRALIFFMLTLVIAWSWEQYRSTTWMPIQEVKVFGTFHHLNKIQLQQAMMPYVDDKNFFSVDINALRDRLLRDPWLADAAISRQWPYKLVIYMTEKTPIARWNDHTLINSDGNLFAPPVQSFPSTLPLLRGTESQQLVVLNSYKQVANILAPLGLSIVDFELSSRQAIHLRLNNGVELVVGREDIFSRLRRFVMIYPKIFTNKDKTVKYIDLRYPNGMAVNWNVSTSTNGQENK